jgi:hypothetical protein
MPTLHVVTTKQFTFRGLPERFSNGYNFQLGSNDPTEAFVASVARAVRDMEKSFHSPHVRFVYLVGGLKDEDAIWSEELGGTGPQGQGSTSTMHPETVVMAEAKKKNKVYLRKFFHTLSHMSSDPAQGDVLQSTAAATINTALAKLTDGTLPGGVKACHPNGDLALNAFTCDPYLRTRQLKRRGRRPTP